MAEASRRKDLVDVARRKIGAEAAAVVGALETQVNQLQLQHRGFVFEVEGLRREVALAKAAPAELRRDVLAFRGDLAMKAEQLEALGLRLINLECRHTTLTATAQREVVEVENRVNGRINDVYAAIGATADQLDALRDNAGADAHRMVRFEALTFWQRLRWLARGTLPPIDYLVRRTDMADG